MQTHLLRIGCEKVYTCRLYYVRMRMKILGQVHAAAINRRQNFLGYSFSRIVTAVVVTELTMFALFWRCLYVVDVHSIVDFRLNISLYLDR